MRNLLICGLVALCGCTSDGGGSGGVSGPGAPVTVDWTAMELPAEVSRGAVMDLVSDRRRTVALVQGPPGVQILEYEGGEWQLSAAGALPGTSSAGATGRRDEAARLFLDGQGDLVVVGAHVDHDPGSVLEGVLRYSPTRWTEDGDAWRQQSEGDWIGVLVELLDQGNGVVGVGRGDSGILSATGDLDGELVYEQQSIPGFEYGSLVSVAEASGQVYAAGFAVLDESYRALESMGILMRKVGNNWESIPGPFESMEGVQYLTLAATQGELIAGGRRTILIDENTNYQEREAWLARYSLIGGGWTVVDIPDARDLEAVYEIESDDRGEWMVLGGDRIAWIASMSRSGRLNVEWMDEDIRLFALKHDRGGGGWMATGYAEESSWTPLVLTRAERGFW